MGYTILWLLALFLEMSCKHNIVLKIRNSNFEYQPIIALALPVLREIFYWTSSMIVRKAANGDETLSLIYLRYMVDIDYACTLCVVLGSIATNATQLVLMSIDYIFNLWLTLNLVWTKKKHPAMIQKQIDTLQELALAELAEFLGPMAYIMLFAGATSGPNL